MLLTDRTISSTYPLKYTATRIPARIENAPRNADSAEIRKRWFNDKNDGSITSGFDPSINRSLSKLFDAWIVFDRW